MTYEATTYTSSGSNYINVPYTVTTWPAWSIQGATMSKTDSALKIVKILMDKGLIKEDITTKQLLELLGEISETL